MAVIYRRQASNFYPFFIALQGMFTLVWSAYYVSQRDIDGGDNTDDTGLSL